MRECRPAAGHADLPLICWERIYPTLYQAPLLYTAERPDLHGHRCVEAKVRVFYACTSDGGDESMLCLSVASYGGRRSGGQAVTDTATEA